MSTQQQTFINAAERYETLYWALKAQRALGKVCVQDEYVPLDGSVPEGCTVMWKKPNGMSPRRRLRYVSSTLPGQKIMGEWERNILERQLAKAPGVSPSDVKKAREHMMGTKRDMKRKRPTTNWPMVTEQQATLVAA